jgi:hypothetical protein
MRAQTIGSQIPPATRSEKSIHQCCPLHLASRDRECGRLKRRSIPMNIGQDRDTHYEILKRRHLPMEFTVVIFCPLVWWLAINRHLTHRQGFVCYRLLSSVMAEAVKSGLEFET